MTNIIAYSSPIYNKIFANCEDEFAMIFEPSQLNLQKLQELNPSYIFFVHWSHIIPAEIYENFECVVFHMTDLPFGRGGSPLQNLIVRQVYETKISAIKCTKEIDAGPIYCKEPFSIAKGKAGEIYLEAGVIILKMIKKIIHENLFPVEQKGEVVTFKRRSVKDGDVANLENLSQVFDYIRMLDAPGYPAAFFENKNFRFEFSDASFDSNKINAKVLITQKND